MALTRLDNLISSKTGKYLYVSPDDFNASDELNNRGNSPIRPFKSIQRAFLEIARYSYLPGPDNDRFDQFTIMLMPGNHYIDNRPGLVDTNSIPEFGFNQAMNEWTDNSNLDISDPNNVLYLFNNTEGGAILPRGSSLVGYDLRRTVVRPLYVPDPADKLEKRSAIFNVTGACYFWQFTIKDGDLEPSSPLYDKNEGVGKVYYQNGQWDQLAIPNYSHHKLTVFEYADKEELGLYYQKIAKAFSQYQPTIDDPGEFTDRIQETRIVGPLSDIRSIESIKCTDSSPAGTITVEVTTKVNHGYFKNQFIAIENNGLDEQLNGTFPVSDIDTVDARKFKYQISGVVSSLGTTTNLVNNTVYTAQNGLSANAVVKAEVDSVESASPYVFNCSIRSTWGICGIWANGLKATGFKSMVIAQYTGVSLQKDDRAFIRYDEFTNTWNQANLTDAFDSIPYHTKGDSYWKDDWRNFHVRASEDAFIQNVSIFAVGFADHFLMESGGDMSITNSNSNFGNTSLHAIGFKGFAFNQDKGGYITDIVPPQIVPETTGNTKKVPYYTIDVKASNDPNNHTKLYLGDDEGFDPTDRPAASIDGFRIGTRTDEKLYVKLTPRSAGADNVFSATLTPNGFKKFTATADILNPSGVVINNRNLDAANRIEDNKTFIQEEAYGYITGKFPNLLIRANIDINKCKRDIGYLIDATVQDLRLGGNINTIQAAEAYYVGNNLSYINAELNESLEAYAYTRDLAIAAMRNFDYLRTGASTTAGSSIVNVGDTTGIIQGMTVADYDPSQFVDGKLINNAVRPQAPVIPDNTFVKRVINATEIEIGQKAVYSEKKIVADRFSDARNLVLANQNFIAQEAYERMLLDFPGFVVPTGNPQDCTDDINDVIAAIAENLAYGGNAETWDAAYIYESGAHVAGEEAQTIRAFEYARDMCIQVMRNEDVFVFGSHGLTQSKDLSITYEAPTPVADRNSDARNLILSNKNLIAQEAYARMIVEYPGFVTPTGNPQDCIDDIVDVLEAIADNVAYGGNDKTYDAASVYVKGAHVAGEEAQTVFAFNQAKEMAIQAMRNQQIIVLGTHGLTQTYDNTVTVDVADSVIDRAGDARDLILANQNLIAYEAYDRMLAQNPGFVTPTGNPQDCIDDILGIVENVAWNVSFGGNDRVWDCANVYVTGAHVAGEESQTIEAFEFARDLMIQAMRNETITISGSHGFTQTKDLSITIDPSSPVCADIASSITSLIAVITNAITTPASLAGVSRTLSLGPCNDVRTTIITLFDIINNAIITPTSLSGIQRNLSNGSCQNVASSITTLWDILLTTLANPGYLQSIQRVESPLGLAFGPSVNANANSTNSYLYFDLTAGVYSTTQPTVDDTITQAPEYPECNDVATTIRQYFDNIGTILQTGLNSVPRNEPTQLTTELASRATVWTLRDGTGSNPHNLETGTPVRLVPRPRYDTVTNQYVNVDKRKVRLPNGFETNEKYYVIAPGRTTKPENYSSIGAFDGSDQTKLMLANSKENAAAGIYIHSAEVEGIDPDIEIDIYQFVLDDKYDLHQYACILDNAVNNGIRTDVPHIFDVPFANVQGHQVFFRANEGGNLPLVGSAYAADPSVSDSNGRIREDRFFWARYQNEKVFTIHATKTDAIADLNAITFQPGTYDFSAFADKRESPMRYDPTFQNPGTSPLIYGKWYLQVENHSENQTDPEYTYSILTRLHESTYSDLSGQDKTNDTWFERIKDERDADDRIYRFRYVIPEYLQAVRDPINGFTIKMRKDETRKLLPQKLVLKPVSGSVTKASFYNPVQPNEKIGYTREDFVLNSLNLEDAYDPYRRDIVGGTQYAKIVQTQNYVSMTVESGRYFLDGQSGDELLELTVFDLGITNLALLNETFTTVKITSPQGGNFVASRTQSSDAVNRIEWFGNSSGYGYLHAALNVPGTSEWHLILKGVVGDIDYSEFENIRFSQDAVFADLLTDPDFGKSLYIKDLIRKEYPEYYYRQNGAAVYTVTPGDIITDDANIQYYVESVTDAGELEDTFYIFDVEEVQRRIYGQQEGIYYLTAVRGNISPYPTGAGNQGNFRNMKFSQPISKLYPLNYKNDPLWFKQLDVTEVDPPSTYSAADNYVHGLVRVNDFKGSMTREMVRDFISQPALSNNTYTQVSSTVDNRIRAQKGNATSGSEDRRVPIVGDSTVISDQRLYVELRRPSIARAGNHTFEYLGFGPGNYSTGLPARQEIVLTPTEDFYAQSKKQDGGLVFYTGLNSNGDLYIGNRKIDAITGEEEFLESASLQDSEDDTEDVGNLVTTFDTPVTFNEYITVNGGDQQDRTSTFNSPVVINVLGRVREYSLTVISNVSPSDGDDGTLDKTQQFLNQDTFGDIVIARNRVAASIFQFNPRGSNGAAQGYKIQNHVVGSNGSNYTPNQSALYTSGLGTSLDPLQAVQYGNAGAPLSGDILLKGAEVGVSGSLGWIYANFFEVVPAANIRSFLMNGSTVITITWDNNLKNKQVGITSGSQIRISNYSDNAFNGKWQIIANGFDPEANSCQIAIIENRGNVDNDNPRLWATEVANNPNVRFEFSNSSWKEVGVLGAESIRTDTSAIGDYKVGVNTVARSEHDAWMTGFVDANTEPRANLDVVGNTYISGRKTDNYLDETVFGNRNKNAIRDALVVGGDSASITDYATLRVSTEGNVGIAEAGRTPSAGLVGINATDAQLDRALVVVGDSRFTEDAQFERDIEVHGDGTLAEIRSNIGAGTFNLVPNQTFIGTLRAAPFAEYVRLADERTGDQFFFIGNASPHSNIFIGHTNDQVASNISKVVIGGAYANPSETLSYVTVDTKSFKIAGDVILGVGVDPADRNSLVTRRGLEDVINFTSTAGTVNFLSGNSNTNVLEFATNASTITIAGQGGTTTIRNNLVVDSSATFNSNITLCGGLASFSFSSIRARMGSERISHDSGVLGDNLFNNNVDIITVRRLLTSDVGYNQIDTAASGNWGGTPYQDSIDNIGGNPQIEPQELPQLTGNQYYLPLKYAPLDADGEAYFRENDYLLIDSPEGIDDFYKVITITAASFSELSNGVAISASGAGTGSSGGFATGQDYLWFSDEATGTTGSPRYAVLSTVDASYVDNAGPISRFEIDCYVGNNNNGGEYPDLTDERLQLQYSLDDGSSWTTIGDIIPIIPQANVPSGEAKYTIDVPVAAQQANCKFRLYQQSNTSVDNYGITEIRYFTASGNNISTHPEFVKVVSTPRIATAPYYIIVEREPFGTFTGVRNDHADETAIYRCNVQFGATWTTNDLDNEGVFEDIYLSEFGGQIRINDYIIVGRQDTDEDLIYDVGEVFKVQTPLEQNSKKFRISADCETGEDVFVVDSVTGEIIIGNPSIPGSEIIINTSVKINGGCGTIKYETITGNIIPDPTTTITYYINGISEVDIAKVAVGDNVQILSASLGNSIAETALDNVVTEVTPNGDNSTVRLKYRIAGGQTINGVEFIVKRNEVFEINNGDGQVNFKVDSCTGSTSIGNDFRRMDIQEIYPAPRLAAGSETAFANILDEVRVHSYWIDPVTINNGAITSIRDTVGTHNQYDKQVPVQSTGVGQGAFEVGDLIMVGDPADIANGTGFTEILVIRSIAGAGTADAILICDEGQEGTAVQPTTAYNIGDTVVRILKHPETSRIVDLQERNRGGTPYLSAIIETGHIVQQKLDYTNWVRFENISTSDNNFFLVNGNMVGTVHANTMDERINEGNYPFTRGNLDLTGDLRMIGGSIEIYDSVNKSRILTLSNDKGHADHIGDLKLDAGVTIRGDIKVWPVTCPENILTEVLDDCTPSFTVDSFGNVTCGLSLQVTGVPVDSPSDTFESFSVGNLGPNGANEFSIRRTGRIDSFGIENFYTRTGGRHTRYVSSGSDDADKILIPNIVYMVNVTADDTLVLTLPDDPITGDTIKIVEVGGDLNYRTSLVLRAPGIGVKVQGDDSGTLLGGLSSPYPSGELVVQTPNAAFTLIYLGGTASDGRVGIPTTDQGWWLMEV